MIKISCFTYGLLRKLTGKDQDPDATARDVIEAIVANWDATKVMSPESTRQSARIAICQIGMRWHPSDRYSFSFEDVARMLVDISPELKGAPATGRIMRDILVSHHLSTRCR